MDSYSMALRNRLCHFIDNLSHLNIKDIFTSDYIYNILNLFSLLLPVISD